MLRKVINLKEGLKLTCGAECPVGRGVVESRRTRYGQRAEVIRDNNIRENECRSREGRVDSASRVRWEVEASKSVRPPSSGPIAGEGSKMSAERGPGRSW